MPPTGFNIHLQVGAWSLLGSLDDIVCHVVDSWAQGLRSLCVGSLPFISVRNQSKSFRALTLWIFHILALLGVSKCCTEGGVILGSQYGTHSKRNLLHIWPTSFICMSWQILCKTSLDIYPLQRPHSCTTHSFTLTCYINAISTKTELHSLQNYVEKSLFTRLWWIIHYGHMTGWVQFPLFILAGDTAQGKGQGSLSRFLSRSDNRQLWGWGLSQHFFCIASGVQMSSPWTLTTTTKCVPQTAEKNILKKKVTDVGAESSDRM